MDDMLEETSTKMFPALVSVWKGPEKNCKFHGSGILINKTAVLTCRHVLDEYYEHQINNNLNFQQFKVKHDGIDCKVLDGVFYELDDLALLKLDSSPSFQTTEPLLFFNDLEPLLFFNDLNSKHEKPIRMSVRVCGYRRVHNQEYPKYRDSLRNIKLLDSDGKQLDSLTLEGGVANGLSGGPTYVEQNNQYYCLGVTKKGSNSAVVSEIIPSNILTQFLNKQKIDYPKASVSECDWYSYFTGGDQSPSTNTKQSSHKKQFKKTSPQYDEAKNKKTITSSILQPKPKDDYDKTNSIYKNIFANDIRIFCKEHPDIAERISNYIKVWSNNVSRFQ